MPLKQVQKTARDIVSTYDLRKVHIPYICEDGTSSYLPRSAPRKADLLQERLLTRAAQKKQMTDLAKSTRSGHKARSPQPPAKRGRKAQSPQPLAKEGRKAPPAKEKAKKKTIAEPRLPLPKPVDKLVREPEEEGEEEDDLDILAARDLLEAKDRFKQQRLRAYLQEKAVRVRNEVPGDLTTSDIQDELENIVEDAQAVADFPIEVNIRIYINKTLRKRRNLPDSLRDKFDLSIIEEALAIELETLAEGESFSILHRTAIIRANTIRATNRMHDLEDFSLGETNRVLGLINAAHEQHPRSKIAVTIEIKASVSISKAKSNSHKRKAPDTDLENSSPIPSSPPVSAEKKKSNRTSKLAEQQAIRLDKIAQAGDFERQLADKWICRDKGCTNQDAYCFPDPQDSRTHYSIISVQQKSWAQAISAGECTLQQPPIKIWLYWKSDQGPITRDSRTSGRKTFQQETKDSLENLNEQVERARLQSQLVAEQDKLMQRAEREED